MRVEGNVKLIYLGEYNDVRVNSDAARLSAECVRVYSDSHAFISDLMMDILSYKTIYVFGSFYGAGYMSLELVRKNVSLIFSDNEIKCENLYNNGKMCGVLLTAGWVRIFITCGFDDSANDLFDLVCPIPSQPICEPMPQLNETPEIERLDYDVGQIFPDLNSLLTNNSNAPPTAPVNNVPTDMQPRDALIGAEISQKNIQTAQVDFSHPVMPGSYKLVPNINDIPQSNDTFTALQFSPLEQAFPSPSEILKSIPEPNIPPIYNDSDSDYKNTEKPVRQNKSLKDAIFGFIKKTKSGANSTQPRTQEFFHSNMSPPEQIHQQKNAQHFPAGEIQTMPQNSPKPMQQQPKESKKPKPPKEPKRLKRFLSERNPKRSKPPKISGGEDSKRRQKRILILLLVLMGIIMLVAGWFMFQHYVLDGWKNSSMNDGLKEIYYSTDTNHDATLDTENDRVNPDYEFSDPFLASLGKLAGLYEKNSDTVGWIKIPNTKIDYPVVKTTNNNFYLEHNFNKEYDRYGAIFADKDCKITPAETSKNISLYGHNMNDGSMFGDLKKFKEQKFLEENPVFTFDSLKEESQYVIFAVFITNTRVTQDKDIQGDIRNNYMFEWRTPEFSSDSEFQLFVAELRKRSLYNSPVDVNSYDNIITLSTCTYEFDDARLVIAARQLRIGENYETLPVKENESPLYPQIWYDINGGEKPKV